MSSRTTAIVIEDTDVDHDDDNHSSSNYIDLSMRSQRSNNRTQSADLSIDCKTEIVLKRSIDDNEEAAKAIFNQSRTNVRLSSYPHTLSQLSNYFILNSL